MTVKRTSLLVLLPACLLLGLLIGCGSWGDSLTSLLGGTLPARIIDAGKVESVER